MLLLSDVNKAAIAAYLALRDSRPEAQRRRHDGRQRDGVPAVTAVNSFGEAGLSAVPFSEAYTGSKRGRTRSACP